MTETHLDADRMPVVARGTSAWSAGELAHLAACAECRAEWDMIQMVSGLGSGVVAGLDSARVAQVVGRRLALERGNTAGWRRNARRWLVGLAAAAAVLLVGRLTVTRLIESTSTTSLTVLHELDELNAVELESLLESLPPATAVTGHPEPGSLDELDPTSLERLLRSLEG